MSVRSLPSTGAPDEREPGHAAYAADMERSAQTAPRDFRQALVSLRATPLRPEVRLEETPAPRKLAPYAFALSADVVAGDDDLGTGRFVVLHDPEQPEAWRGTFRVVSFVRADVDPETVSDSLLPAVGWSWLTDALATRKAPYEAASGTVTRLAEESFGLDRPPAAKVEIRASWSPQDAGLGAHLLAWGDLLCQAAGLPPMPPGVATLSGRARH